MLTKLSAYIRFLAILYLYLFVGQGCLSAQNAERNSFADSLKALQAKYLDNNNVDSGLAANAELIRYYKRIGDDYEYVRHKVNRAEVLRAIGGYQEALNTLNEVEDLCKSLALSTVRSTFYNRKAAILHETRQHEKALVAVRESQRIDSIMGYKWRIISNLLIEGAIYRDMKDFEKAELVLQETYHAAVELGDSSERASAAYNLTVLNFRLKQYDRTIRFGRKFIDLSPFGEAQITYGDVLHLLARAYEQGQNFDSAYYFLDSVYGVRMRHMQRIIDDNSSKYEVVDELERERYENSILEAEKEQSRLQIILLLFTIVVAIGLVFFAYRQREQYKRSVAQKEAYNRELENSLNFKNKLISIVAHDIRNPMASLKGLLQVYNEGLANEQDLKPMMRGLEASVGNVDLLLENLLNFVRTKSGDLDPHFEETEIKPLVEAAVSEAHAQLLDKNISVNTEVLAEGDKVMSDGSYLSFILRNLLSNAIKFSHRDGEIKIYCEHQENKDCIVIEDFGRGMNEEKLRQLREFGSIRSDRGTENEKGTGLGIGLSQEFLEKLNGKMHIESSLGEGTKVKICLPKG